MNYHSIYDQGVGDLLSERDGALPKIFASHLLYAICVLGWINLTAGEVLAASWEDFKETNYEARYGISNSSPEGNEAKNGAVCRSVEYETYSEFIAFLAKNDLSLEYALINSSCALELEKTVIHGPALHKAVYGGAKVTSLTNGVLRYLYEMENSSERAALFAIILDGGKVDYNLIEYTVMQIEKHDGRQKNLISAAKRLCRAIEIFELQNVLGAYLYDPIKGCLHPTIDFKAER